MCTKSEEWAIIRKTIMCNNSKYIKKILKKSKQ